jgi:acetyl-CoA C-acetyltransferase
MTACIVGWGHTKFGKLDGQDAEALIVAACREAIEDAGIAPTDIDEIFVGHYGGMDPQDFLAAMPLQTDPRMRFTPCTRVENACASGSAAIHEGLNAIGAKRARFVLAVGIEKMTAVDSSEVGRVLGRGAYQKDPNAQGMTFPGLFGRLTEQYFQAHGDQSDALAMIAAKNHANGAKNRFAHIQKDLGYEFCRTVSEKNPLVAGPLKRSDCSLISDGCAAVVLADVETALTMKKAVAFRAAQHVQDFLPLANRDVLAFEGPALAFQRAFAQAKVSLGDLDFVEVHDCFTTAELLAYEAMGLAPKGQGARAIQEGWTRPDGKLPVNPSGGLKSKGHPIGATGVSMHVMAAMQVTGQAGPMQVKDAGLGAVFNMGGVAVANFVSVLERLR